MARPKNKPDYNAEHITQEIIMNKKLQEEKKEGHYQSITIADEFHAVRDEIVAYLGIRSNYIIAQSTLCWTVLGFSIQQKNSVLALLVYFVAITFQAAINKNIETCSRLSAFIQAFFESDLEGEWHWEYDRFAVNEHVWEKNEGVRKSKNYKKMKKLYDIIHWYAPCFYGIVAGIICLYLWYNEKSMHNMIAVFLAGIFIVITFIVNHQMDQLDDKICEDYRNQMIKYKKENRKQKGFS